MKQAFKEWAVICRALATGRQVLIFRKGGIDEVAGAFQLEHRKFLLFPTGFHQSQDQLQPEAKMLLGDALAERPAEGRVTISHCAVVADAIGVDTLSTLCALRGDHIWSDAVVEERFHRWGEEGVCVMIVRVYRLCEPVTIALKEDYAGCKSWVDLDEDIPIDGAVPVVTDEAFANRRVEIRKFLKGV